MNLSAVLLAAGNSSRFGSNKLLHEVEGKPMAQHIMDTIKDIDFDKTVVVTGYPEVKDMAAQHGYKVVENPNPEMGQSHSLALGLNECMNEDGCMFFVCDQPNLKKDTVLKMTRLFEENPHSIICAAIGKKKGNPAVFPKELFSELMKISGDTGGREVFKHHEDLIVKCYIDDHHELSDIDYPK